MPIARLQNDRFVRNTLAVAVATAFAVFAVVTKLPMRSGSVLLERTSVATSMQTSKDGFGFPNFTAAATFEQFNTSDLLRMFGRSVCMDKQAAGCEPKAQAIAWAQMVNQAR